jgi:hypothetical protein
LRIGKSVRHNVCSWARDVRGLLRALRVPLALATGAVALALVLQIMSGLNGVIPERNPHEMARTAVSLLLLDTLVLAWMALLRRPT